MTPTFSPEQMREMAMMAERNHEWFRDTCADKFVAMLRQAADTQDAIRVLRQTIRERGNDCASNKRRTAYFNVLGHMDELDLALPASPDPSVAKETT